VRERKIGTELFVTVATTIALLSGEYVAASVLMTIILIAEFIAEVNTDRARASINALVGAAPRRAMQRIADGDRVVPVDTLRRGDIVLVRAGETVPVDGAVTSGAGSVNEATITGESLPIDKEVGGSVLAGTLLESGALDVRTDKVGADTLFARIISLVEQAESGRIRRAHHHQYRLPDHSQRRRSRHERAGSRRRRTHPPSVAAGPHHLRAVRILTGHDGAPQGEGASPSGGVESRSRRRRRRTRCRSRSK
jgi:magnesium-transporting ATPase (P-type)